MPVLFTSTPRLVYPIVRICFPRLRADLQYSVDPYVSGLVQRALRRVGQAAVEAVKVVIRGQ